MVETRLAAVVEDRVRTGDPDCGHYRKIRVSGLGGRADS